MQILGISGTYQDVVTAASSTAAQPFQSVYVPSATLTAANTGVTTSTASSLVVQGPPSAGTNQTITNPFALNVLAGNSRMNGNLFINNMVIHTTAQQYTGRFYLTSNWTPASGWNYLPSQFGVAADIPPSINASVSTTNSGTTVNYNSSTGLIFIPQSGTWNINVWAAYLINVSTANSYEFRLCVYSAPAWPAAGSVAKSFGSGQTAGTLSGISAAQLASSALVTVNESGLCFTGKFPAGTLLALIVYSGSGNMGFNSNPAGLYIEASMINALT